MTNNDSHIAAADDARLRQIFDDYRPELGSDADFMVRVRRGLDAVESLREELAAVQRRNRRAIVWATLAGMVSGALLTAATPDISSLLAVPASYASLVGSILVGVGTVLVVVATFARFRGRVPSLHA